MTNLGSSTLLFSLPENSAVVAFINKEGGTKSCSLMDETRRIFRMTDNLQGMIHVHHIRGIYILVDSFSRANKVVATAWTPQPQALEFISQVWVLPLKDFFATRLNKRRQSLSVWGHGQSISWDGILGSAYPRYRNYHLPSNQDQFC